MPKDFAVKRAAFVCLVAVSLAGCEAGLNERQQDEAADVAHDVARDAIDGSGRIAELEARIEVLEARMDEQEVY
ncbi:MAG: hypothetical protein K2X07_05035 [Caulobacteraceae bacterium]|nr:hypothetical protein [Caulobacteraceae bacterium]